MRRADKTNLSIARIAVHKQTRQENRTEDEKTEAPRREV